MILTENTIENTLDLGRLEKEIYRHCCEYGCELFKTTLLQLDERLMLERDRAAYRHKGKRKTVLKTIMGEVEYERTLYEHQDENGVKSYVYFAEAGLHGIKIHCRLITVLRGRGGAMRAVSRSGVNTAATNALS